MQLNHITSSWKAPAAVIASMLMLVTLPTVSGAHNQLSQKDVLGSLPGLTSSSPTEHLVDGSNFIEKWFDSARDLKDYTFNFSMTVFKENGSKVVEQGELAFKQPHLLRLAVTGGQKKGSVAVLTKEGNVRAHMGGAMSFLTVSLDAESNYLKSVNGWPMVKSDFESLAEAVKGYIKEGCTDKVSSTPVAVEGYSNKVYDWSLYKPNGVIYKRALFDPSTMQPVEWWDFVDGKLYSRSQWTNLNANAGLSDKTFTMKGG